MEFKLNTKYPVLREHHIGDNGFEENQWLFRFANEYGASVICHKMNGRIVTYGNLHAPFELAVIKFDGDNYDLCYSTSITDDVIGYLTNVEVEKLLEQIEAL